MERMQDTGLENDFSCIFVLTVSSGMVIEVSIAPATAPAKKALDEPFEDMVHGGIVLFSGCTWTAVSSPPHKSKRENETARGMKL